MWINQEHMQLDFSWMPGSWISVIQVCSLIFFLKKKAQFSRQIEIQKGIHDVHPKFGKLSPHRCSYTQMKVMINVSPRVDILRLFIHKSNSVRFQLNERTSSCRWLNLKSQAKQILFSWGWNDSVLLCFRLQVWTAILSFTNNRCRVYHHVHQQGAFSLIEQMHKH